MPFEIDRGGVIRGNRKDVDLIAILYRKASQLGGYGLGIARFSDLHADQGALFMRHQPLHFDVPQGRRRKNSARKAKRVLERLFAA